MAMADARDVKAALQRELDMLSKARDELRAQVKLAKNEAQQEWKKLEAMWQGVETEFKRVGEQSKEPVKDMAAAARALMDELRHGYERVKVQLTEARQSRPAMPQPSPAPQSQQQPAPKPKQPQPPRGPSP
jgi:predicted  nucleic acid-binding Zn-ribbon protein